MTTNTRMASLYLHEQYAYFIKRTCWYEHAHEQNAKEFAYVSLGLAGETGEFADVVKKTVREHGFDGSQREWDTALSKGVKDKMLAELGDVLWYVTRMATLLNVSIDDLMLMNTYKLFNRIEKGEWSPPMAIEWPFSAGQHSYSNVQLTYFSHDIDDQPYDTEAEEDEAYERIRQQQIDDAADDDDDEAKGNN